MEGRPGRLLPKTGVTLNVKRLLQVPALAVRQSKHSLFLFAVDGKDLESFTTVNRAKRGDDWLVQGYQRPEIYQHVREIADYLLTDNPMLPNSLVVGFDRNSVTFKPVQKFGIATFGMLTIPTAEDHQARCGFVVDGQQRRAAIRESGVTGFPVLVSGFLANTEEERREQFILVNSTKPLPRALIFELLPGTEAKLPRRFSKHKLAVVLLERMNLDADSPLRMLVRTPTQPLGVIKDNSLLKGIANSLTDGVLFGYVHSQEQPDLDGAAAVLKDFWRAVSQVFPKDWGRPASQSRLLHGAGVVALSFIMDAISDLKGANYDNFLDGLRLIQPHCHWSSGTWEFGRKYNDIQNTPKDVSMFCNWLSRRYLDLVRGKPLAG